MEVKVLAEAAFTAAQVSTNTREMKAAVSFVVLAAMAAGVRIARAVNIDMVMAVSAAGVALPLMEAVASTVHQDVIHTNRKGECNA